MKKIFYLFLILSLAFGLQSCGGSGGNADDPEPGPEPGAPKAKVSFALKSDINGVQDNDLKTALTHLRLYLYDKDQKLVSVNKYTSADALKAIELEIIPLCWSGMFRKTGIFPPKQSVRHFPACLYN